MEPEFKELARLKRHKRTRLKIYGTSSRPRLVIHRSLKNLYASIIDDTKNRTLFSLSTKDLEVKKRFPYTGNVKAAEFFGDIFAKKVKEKGFTEIVFDRAGYLYHGRIKAFAESLRKMGLKF